MTNPYRILIIEDDPDDVELILLGFSKHDEFFLDVATTGEEGLEMISETSYDLISVDFALPGISGLDVLEEIRKTDQDVPVVMVTGRGTEELQVVAFEKFATSYVMKSVDSFRSLPTIFEALINESKFRSRERRMRRDIERSEAVSRYILENSPTGIYVLQNGCFKMVNSKFREIFGYEEEDLIGEPFWSLADPDRFEPLEGTTRDRGPRRPVVHEFGIVRKDGSRRWVEAMIVTFDYQDERWVLGSLVDVTDRKEDEKDRQMDNRRGSILHTLLLKAIDFRGEEDDLMKEALSDSMAGLEGFVVGGIFLLDRGQPVLRALAGPLEVLMSLIDQAGSEVFFERSGVGVVVEGGRTLYWASAPFWSGKEPKGLLVLGRVREIEPDLLTFIEDIAWHVGKMEEIFRLRGSPQGEG